MCSRYKLGAPQKKPKAKAARLMQVPPQTSMDSKRCALMAVFILYNAMLAGINPKKEEISASKKDRFSFITSDVYDMNNFAMACPLICSKLLTSLLTVTT